MLTIERDYYQLERIRVILMVMYLFQVEEKMRVDHERKSEKLKHMDRRGSEAQKVDATRTLVRSLSTKIKIAIQVVDKISMKISRLRDKELWPQLSEFIKGYVNPNAYMSKLYSYVVPLLSVD